MGEDAAELREIDLAVVVEVHHFHQPAEHVVWDAEVEHGVEHILELCRRRGWG